MSRIIENPKELILDHSKDILYRDGYSNFSMRVVAKECGLGIGTIYNYFPTKKDIIIELIADYWRENFRTLDAVLSSDASLYVKLEHTFDNIKIFIKNFKDVWLSMSCFNEDHYVVSGLERESVFMEILIRKIESVLVEESKSPNSKVCMKMDSYEIAKFIFQNFIAMAQMPFIEYQTFEIILKQLLEK